MRFIPLFWNIDFIPQRAVRTHSRWSPLDGLYISYTLWWTEIEVSNTLRWIDIFEIANPLLSGWVGGAVLFFRLESGREVEFWPVFCFCLAYKFGFNAHFFSLFRHFSRPLFWLFLEQKIRLRGHNFFFFTRLIVFSWVLFAFIIVSIKHYVLCAIMWIMKWVNFDTFCWDKRVFGWYRTKVQVWLGFVRRKSSFLRRIIRQLSKEKAEGAFFIRNVHSSCCYLFWACSFFPQNLIIKISRLV